MDFLAHYPTTPGVILLVALILPATPAGAHSDRKPSSQVCPGSWRSYSAELYLIVFTVGSRSTATSPHRPLQDHEEEMLKALHLASSLLLLD
jgi:hypothetical protein